MKIGKIAWILILFSIFFIALTGNEARAAFWNDCSCDTKRDSEGNKSCVPEKNNCPDGKEPTCQYNLDGGCNRKITQGANCVCLAPGEDVSAGVYEGYDEFCVQQGFGPQTNDPRIRTALGCVPVKMSSFVTWLLPYFFGIAGGVSFLIMVSSFLSIAMSSGDPKAVAEAREKITSAITGLLVSVFAIFLLRLIAVDILQIPGFN